jgi:hypothetical protein
MCCGLFCLTRKTPRITAEDKASVKSVMASIGTGLAIDIPQAGAPISTSKLEDQEPT